MIGSEVKLSMRIGGPSTTGVSVVNKVAWSKTTCGGVRPQATAKLAVF